MQIQKSFNKQYTLGTLYLVPTPIGNLQDITLRAVETLKNVDYICAEDTRNTGLLLKHLAIKTRQISFHEHNAAEKIPALLALLQDGKSLAQVSDAGMPSISDPGYELVQAALDQNIAVVALPGASAGITALIASGLLPQPHVFYGFLPRKAGQQKAFFSTKKNYPETQIYYESPYRLAATLKNMLAVYGDRKIALVRELTKRYEEYQRGTVSEILAYIEEQPPKGECLLIVAGCQAAREPENLTEQDIQVSVRDFIAEGLAPNAAIKKTAKAAGLSRQEVYNIYHDLKD
ncbi:16S rRNA (cytidine(1402)-2'-O)-methyltransferase [Streptococcus chenjunshii]|uniref:Ribosomal RNA small subunit methyltransferase I n=1 Tax=Streptococcus chenjunshii TaxID=2173853 RepID=A0A372KM83_9STRE|nr:16S rRNA (cytidine(1402)-2'-O)-methyltransferase [Streptococcus chenjunshii]AXQ79161.1 16S rRNA (cytidine(1402)-2'-O)-methyltransferase [Streptococcus chenjunshii]RFU50994.1 16S rRNA (cytidine(1402)-2'-O)-methyltransferase [Streptococcus chenjunshii]RFU53387.1 16S rRNA (cytidine(1402)-2'-O)-methyltransferase [Streptococcus chenjunshii]